jgi:thiosulfate reductase cytochrome b subunit
MKERLDLYPLWIRIWHWVNALMFLVLIFTGLSMQYSDPGYPMIRFDIAVSLHNLSAVVLSFSFILFVVSNSLTGNYKYYKFRQKGSMVRTIRQFRFYLSGIFQNDEPPYPVSKERKFNPLQKISYVVAMYFLMPAMIITGFALMFPEVIISNVFGISGIHLTDLVHIICGFILSIFMIVHIYFSTIGGSPLGNFKSMISGWHITR